MAVRGAPLVPDSGVEELDVEPLGDALSVAEVERDRTGAADADARAESDSRAERAAVPRALRSAVGAGGSERDGERTADAPALSAGRVADARDEGRSERSGACERDARSLRSDDSEAIGEREKRNRSDRRAVGGAFTVAAAADTLASGEDVELAPSEPLADADAEGARDALSDAAALAEGDASALGADDGAGEVDSLAAAAEALASGEDVELAPSEPLADADAEGAADAVSDAAALAEGDASALGADDGAGEVDSLAAAAEALASGDDVELAPSEPKADADAEGAADAVSDAAALAEGDASALGAADALAAADGVPLPPPGAQTALKEPESQRDASLVVHAPSATICTLLRRSQRGLEE